jgi:TonB family protein
VAVAYLVLVRPMHRIAFTVLAAIPILAACSTNGSKVVEHRQNVTYSAQEWGPASSHVTGVDVPPHPVGGMAAFVKRLDYPPDLRRRRITGVVRIVVSLDATGRVLSARIIQRVNPVLDAIVLRAVQQTKWEPAVRAGKSVPVKFKFPVTFLA